MQPRTNFCAMAISCIVASSLTIMVFAEIISPPLTDSLRAEATLDKNITGSVNETLELTLSINKPDKDIHAAISLDTGNRHAIIGSLQLPGNLESIHIDEDNQLAYLANSYSGLQIVDISDPENLHIHGSLAELGHAWDITVRDDILYLASARDGLFLIDIRSSESPAIISQFNFKKYSILKLAVSNQTIYASTGKTGLLVIDISNIKAPRLVKTLYAETGAYGLLTDKNRLFVSCGEHRLEVLDLSRPTHPKKIGELALPDRAWNMAIRENMLYLPTHNEGLLIIDASKPYSPERLNSAPIIVQPDSIYLKHGQAYISSRSGSLSILDLTIPASPELVNTFDLPYRPRSIAISNQTTYMASGFDGLQALRTDRLVSADQIKRLQVPGTLVKVLRDDSFFYLGTGNNGGLHVTRRDPSGDPGVMIATLPIEGINNMVRIGNYLFLACSQAGLQIVNITDPTAPRIIKHSVSSKNSKDIIAKKNRLYLADFEQGLQVIDVASPEEPLLLGSFPLQQLMKLAADDRYIYAATTETGLHILDYATPEAPKQIGSLELPWPLQDFAAVKQIAVSGKTIYLAAGTAELIAFDISDPTAPILKEIINLDGEPQAVTVERNLLFVSTRQGKLYVLHEEENERLHRWAVIDTLGKGLDLVVDGDRIIVVNRVKGLTMIPIPEQVKILNRKTQKAHPKATTRLTVRIPPQSTPGVYNLTIFNRGEQIDFVGAVELRETTD